MYCYSINIIIIIIIIIISISISISIIIIIIIIMAEYIKELKKLVKGSYRTPSMGVFHWGDLDQDH